ncbi:hypothetical protein BU23DRAFT_420101, partial [Bimuria novae-zelandiae CBS 107.79]
MPIQEPYQLPDSAQDLPVAGEQNAIFFLNFIASISPETQQSWCPDVRAALPYTDAAFSSETDPQVGYVHVGQKPEWKDLTNIYRKKWNVHSVPTLIRYQRIDGEVKETGRLVEADLLDQKKLTELVS